MKHEQKEIIIDNKKVLVDIDCILLVDLFNKQGLKTYMCCQGNGNNASPFRIIFDISITDDNIAEFIKPYLNKYGHSNLTGRFIKWGRFINNKIQYNWMYENYNKTYADLDYNRFISHLVEE